MSDGLKDYTNPVVAANRVIELTDRLENDDTLPPDERDLLQGEVALLAPLLAYTVLQRVTEREALKNLASSDETATWEGAKDAGMEL